jgi:signal peptidase II
MFSKDARPSIGALLQPHNRLFFVVVALALIADQLTKWIVEATVPVNTTSARIIGHWLQVTHTQNTGAAFSMLQGAGWVFSIAAIIVTGVVLYSLTRLPAHERFTRLCLGLIIGGALGNFIDRLRQGFVTDMIHFQIPEINFDFPVWNVADSCVFVGVVSMMVWNYVQERRMAQRAHSRPEEI